MAGLGSLTIDLAANISKFERALSRADKLADKRAKGIKRTFVKLSAGIGVALTSAGFVKAIDASLDFADSIGKAADRAGIATGKLQEYRFAADQFGISTQQMDDGLRRFTRRLGVALDGGSFAKDFDELGIAIRNVDFSARTSGDVLDDVVRAMGNLESAAQKSKVAAQLFGDDTGPQLALLLGQGESAINSFARQANDLGLILSEDLIRAAEESNDELSILGQVLKIELTSAIVELAPHITSITRDLITMTQEVAKFFGGVEAMNGDELVAEIEKITGQLDKAKTDLADKRDEDGDNSAVDALSDLLLPSPEFLETRIQQLEEKLLEAEVRLGAVNLQKALGGDESEGSDGGKVNFFTGLTDSEMEGELQRAIMMEEALTDWLDSEGVKRIEQEKKYQNAVHDMRTMATNHGIALLRRFAADNKAISLVLIAIQAKKAITEVQIASTASSAQVLAYGAVEAAAHAAYFNYGAAAAAEAKALATVAKIQSAAQLSTAFILGSAAFDAYSVATGGGLDTSTGTVYNPATTDVGTAPGTVDSGIVDSSASGTSGTITINVNGVVTEEIMQDLVIPAIQDATNDKDIILFNNDSRQAIELEA